MAHDDFLDVFGGDFGSLEGFADGDSAELGGAQGGESAQELADRGAGGADYLSVIVYFADSFVYLLKLT